MTNTEVIRNAQSAFVAALDAGIDEQLLIDAIFDASNERTALLRESLMEPSVYRRNSEITRKT